MNLYLLSLVVLVSVATAKLTVMESEYPEKIDGQYIILYHDNTTEEDMTRHVKQFGASENNEIFHVYKIKDYFKGFAARLDDESLQRLLDDDPLVKSVHADLKVSLDANSCGSQQASPRSWGLGRLSTWGSNSRTPYYYNQNSGGDGVDVYVIDTGILTTHPDFGGRAYHAANYAGGSNTDQNGHGTHCAGTVGGTTSGVAKYSTLYAVKVLGADGGGTLNGVIAGVNYVANNYDGNRGCVASMSLGSSYSAPVNNAVAALVSSGCTTAVAAGNSNANACNYSPASTPSSICVGATNWNDQRASFSNYGNCVHIFAPGQEIDSAYLGNTYRSLSGTSMACPHVAGQAAVILSENPNFSPAQVKARIIEQGQKNLISNPGAGSPNNLLYNGCDDA